MRTRKPGARIAMDRGQDPSRAAPPGHAPAREQGMAPEELNQGREIYPEESGGV